MGCAKAVDIIIYQGNKLKRIEVKTSRNTRFVTGFFQKYYNRAQSNHPDYWVLVHVDTQNSFHYYILTHEEMGNVQMNRNGFSSWQQNKTGVDNVSLNDVKPFENCWDKITSTI